MSCPGRDDPVKTSETTSAYPAADKRYPLSETLGVVALLLGGVPLVTSLILRVIE